MNFDKPTKIITKNFYDNRGFFKEVFLKKNFKTNFIFDCFSSSKKNVFRGLHLQTAKQQAKIITVVKGSIIDYAIDLRKKSKNFKKIYKFKITEKSNFSLYIPVGFAHGFLCTSKSCNVYYKCSNYRNQQSELTINYNILKIKNKNLILSKKDREAKSLIKILDHKLI